MYADALMWVRHSLDLAHGAGPQMRFTHADNAPFGREIHWNSGFAWLIVGAGSLRHLFTGEPLPGAIEEALAWFNLPLLLGFIVLMTVWVSRRAGLAAAVFLTFAMVGNDDFYGGFGPNSLTITACSQRSSSGWSSGLCLWGRAFGERRNRTRNCSRPRSRCAPRSDRLGDFRSGRHVGQRRNADSGHRDRRHLGRHRDAAACSSRERSGRAHRTGSLASLGTHRWLDVPRTLFDGVRSHAPWFPPRGESSGLRDGVVGRQRGHRAVRRVALPHDTTVCGTLAAVVVRARRNCPGAALTIAIGGSKVFVVFDPFVTRLSRHVAEGISLPNAIQYFGAMHFLSQFVWTGVSLVIGLFAWWRVRSADRIVLAFIVLAVLAFSAMEVTQLRWSPSAAGPQMVLIVLAIAAVAVARGPTLRWIAIAVATAGLCLPFAILRLYHLRVANAARAVDKTDAMQPVYRDIAAALRASQPEGTIVLLASPNASVAISYYGLFQSIGTLYWENLDGTKAAAEMFSAQTEVEARRKIRARGVTHLAMVSEDNFLAEYFDLLHPQPKNESVAASFGYKTLVGLTIPLWLEQIPYELPPDLPYRPARVLLFKTVFANNKADDQYEQALDAADAGHLDLAATKIDAALALDPKCAEIWVAKTNTSPQCRRDGPGRCCRQSGGENGDAGAAVHHL